jgi:hypothetical protein
MDSELLKDAFMIHDIPEGMLDMEYDVLSGDKKQSHDLSEYLIFRKNFEHFDESLFSHLHQAFLLQFAHKNDEDLNMFPDDAIAIMKNLRMMHPYIVLLFPALERWEYLFYAYEGYVHHDDVGIFVNVLRAQVPHLQGYASTIDGFREVLFTKQFEDKCLEFMERNSEIPVVKKIKKS